MNTLNRVFKKIINYSELGLIVALILLLVGAKIFTPSFYSFKSVTSMLTNNAVYAILTIGIMFVLLTGGIDISIGSILGVSGVVVTRLLLAFPKVPVFVWIIVGIVIGCICGAINGFLVGKMKVLSMIVTLGTMYAFRGLAFVISDGDISAACDMSIDHCFIVEFACDVGIGHNDIFFFLNFQEIQDINN